MEKEVKEGRLLVSAYIVLLLGISSIRLANSLYSAGVQNLYVQLIQVSISLILAWSLYKGSDWTRKLLGGLTLLASVLGLIMLLNVVHFSWKALLLCLYTLTTGIAGIMLLISKKVKRFMEYQNRISQQK